MAGGEAPTETWESLGRDPGWRWVAVPDPGLTGPSAPSQFSVRRRVAGVKSAARRFAMSLRSTLDTDNPTSRSALCEGAGACEPLRVVRVAGLGSAAGGWVVGLGAGESCCGLVGFGGFGFRDGFGAESSHEVCLAVSLRRPATL